MENILKRLQAKKERLHEARPLSPAILQRLQDSFAVEWTYNSNGIEGNTLTLQETQVVLRDGITIGGKSMREHFEVKNHEKAIFFVEQLVMDTEELTEKNLLHLHALILDDIDQQWAGRYRNGQVRIAGSMHVPPNARSVSTNVSTLLQWIRNNPDGLDPVLLAAYAHHRFVNIHPFFDGNGRTGRLLMNFILMQCGYPPAIILKNDRYKYYDALERAHRGDMAKIELVVSQALERSLDLYLEAIEDVSDDQLYVPLRDIAPQFHMSQEYLSLLVRRGKIDGFKHGRNWVSSKKAIEAYFASMQKKK